MPAPQDITGQVRHLRKELTKAKRLIQALPERALSRDVFALFVYTLVLATLLSQLGLIVLMELF